MIQISNVELIATGLLPQLLKDILLVSVLVGVMYKFLKNL